MFDEWGYGIVAESQSQPQSIVQKIARTNDFPTVDYAELRVRRNSLPSTRTRTPLALEFPFTRREKLAFWAPSVVLRPQIELPSPTLGGDLAASYLSDLHSDATALADSLEGTDRRIDALIEALCVLSTKSTDILDNQRHLDTLHEDIGASLKVYDRLEEITRLLNSPGNRIVSSSTFPQILADLATGLKFCEQHPNFKDMDLYELRYQQGIARANSMVLDYCTGLWRSVQASIAPKLAENNTSQVTVEALLWHKFGTDTAKLQPIISHTTGQIRLELEKAYSNIRAQLLASQVSQTVAPSFSQTLSQIKDIFSREKQLWVQTFGSNSEPGFESFSLVFSEPMYIEIRGQIIHETSIDALCNIIILLQGDPLAVSQQILKDAQNRLLFRADQTMDQTLRTKVSVKDLRQPDFVYVRNTLDLLSQLYEVMTQSVFEQFAHQSVRSCMLALRGIGADNILGPTEGHLFHIRQIVALQQGIIKYDLHQVSEQHIDFGGILLLIDTVRTTPQTLLSFEKFVGSIPQVVEQLSNSLQELHAELQVVVQQFTAVCVNDLLAAVSKNDPATAQKDNSVLRELMPKVLQRIWSLMNQHMKSSKIIDALMDSVYDSLIEAYSDYYNLIYNAGSPDQLQGVLDTDAFVAWLAHIRELSRDENASA